MQSYLAIKARATANAWAQLGGYGKQQGDTAAAQYQQVLTASALESPGSIFAADGRARGAARDESDRPVLLPEEPGALRPALSKGDRRLQRVADGFPERREVRVARNPCGDAQLGVYGAAQLAGNTKVALKARQRYVELAPTSPNLKQLEAKCKQLGGSCVPKSK